MNFLFFFFNLKIYFKRKIYEKLSNALNCDDSQAFYLQKVEEINPNIRYCNYILGDETAKKDLMDMKLKSGTGSELAEKLEVLIAIFCLTNLFIDIKHN